MSHCRLIALYLPKSPAARNRQHGMTRSAAGSLWEETRLTFTTYVTTSVHLWNARHAPEPCAQVRILPRALLEMGRDLRICPGHEADPSPVRVGSRSPRMSALARADYVTRGIGSDRLPDLFLG